MITINGSSIRLVIALVCAFTKDLYGAESQFGAVLNDPTAFHSKRVTLVAVTEVAGIEVFLYPDIRSRLKADFAKCVSVTWDRHRRSYQELNNHWVEVIGIIDAFHHGPVLGVDRCEVHLEKVRDLGPSSIKDTSVYVEFINDMHVKLDVKFPTTYGDGEVSNIRPGESTGKVAIAKGLVSAVDEEGRVFATGVIDLQNRTASARNVRRFRIRNSKILRER